MATEYRDRALAGDSRDRERLALATKLETADSGSEPDVKTRMERRLTMLSRLDHDNEPFPDLAPRLRGRVQRSLLRVAAGHGEGVVRVPPPSSRPTLGELHRATGGSLVLLRGSLRPWQIRRLLSVLFPR